jgi:hypothetical protein
MHRLCLEPLYSPCDSTNAGTVKPFNRAKVLAQPQPFRTPRCAARGILVGDFLGVSNRHKCIESNGLQLEQRHGDAGEPTTSFWQQESMGFVLMVMLVKETKTMNISLVKITFIHGHNHCNAWQILLFIFIKRRVHLRGDGTMGITSRITL